MKDKKDKIYYFQEKSNDILDLQDEFTIEEIGIYFILKAAYFKYVGELKKENVCQRCKYFGNLEKFNQMILKLFDEIDGNLINKSWLSEINDIKDRSEKRKNAANERWNKPKKTKKNPTIIQDNPQEPNGLDPQFEKFWQSYIPVKTKDGFIQKGSKQKAEIAFNKAIKKNPIDKIMKALESYLRYCSENQRFTKNVVTWLNDANFEEIETTVIIAEKPTQTNSNSTFNNLMEEYANK